MVMRAEAWQKDCPIQPCVNASDVCIECTCTTVEAGQCQVSEECKFSSLEILKSNEYQYEYDVDIELLSEDQGDSMDVCPSENTDYQFQTDNKNLTLWMEGYDCYPGLDLTCKTADAITPKGKLIKLDGITEVLVDVTICIQYGDGGEIVCDEDGGDRRIDDGEGSCRVRCDGDGGEGSCGVNTGQCQPLGLREVRKKRAISATALRFKSSTVGQTTLRSVPYTGGCPSPNMCVRNSRGKARCCALIILVRTSRVACPRRC